MIYKTPLFEVPMYKLKASRHAEIKQWMLDNVFPDFEKNGPNEPSRNLYSSYFPGAPKLDHTTFSNFYAKDIILIGDAGFPNSKDFNYGWQFKLQYRDKGSSADWVTLEEKGPFNTSEITTQFYQISPYYGLLGVLNSPYYLEMIAFKTNIPLFLDDSNYEFRIAKYEKLAVFSSDLDVIKKVNFIPIKDK
jgi:hypothetical protein